MEAGGTAGQGQGDKVYRAHHLRVAKLASRMHGPALRMNRAPQARADDDRRPTIIGAPHCRGLPFPSSRFPGVRFGDAQRPKTYSPPRPFAGSAACALRGIGRAIFTREAALAYGPDDEAFASVGRAGGRPPQPAGTGA